MFWITLLSISCVVSMVTILLLCMCWKQTQRKDDWLGLEGMVKQKNPDENVNHIPLPSAVSLQNPELNAHDVDSFANPTILVTSPPDDFLSTTLQKRSPSQGNNTHRSLPDIPSEGQNKHLWEVANGDNSSDLYATLEPYAGKQNANLASSSKLVNAEPLNALDDACSPYASVNYDKLPNVEHPYAIVKSPKTHTNNERSQENCENLFLNTTDADDHDSFEMEHADEQAPENINAASAVAGGVAASQDLPYMTPPINAELVQQQINFSGDSQDSSKGYTSISVREPLANILAHTLLKESTKSLVKRSAVDPHYSTVSDDSDEMYTTIPDSTNNQEYTSESETYAQIQPIVLTVAADINPMPSNYVAETTNAVSIATNEGNCGTSQAGYDNNETPHAPSAGSLKSVTASHSRQDEKESFAASSTSLTFNLGSPKPEKRQANSPLPPPPKTPDSANRFLNNANVSVEEMYAKVHKNRKLKPIKSPNLFTTDVENKLLESENDKAREHNYETLKRSPQKQVNNNSTSNKKCDGYETVSIGNDCCDEDPNYEKLADMKGYVSSADGEVPGYSVVNKNQKYYEVINKDEVADEPNYESVKYFDLSNDDVKSNDAAVYLAEDSSYSGYETVDTRSSNNNVYLQLKNQEDYCLENCELDGRLKAANDCGLADKKKPHSNHVCSTYDETDRSLNIRASHDNEQEEEEDDENVVFEV